jgi:undecaprenyl diphosphate synthase
LNYGARQEIVDAVKKVAGAAVEGRMNIQDLNVDSFARYIYTADLPDPDLLIRTSGQMRISNFLLWQISYAELYFPQKYWPDFKKEDLEEAVRVFQNRERRFGGINAIQKDN